MFRGEIVYYTITEFDFDQDGKKGTIVRAELDCREDFDTLIGKLFKYRDEHYKQKEDVK